MAEAGIRLTHVEGKLTAKRRLSHCDRELLSSCNLLWEALVKPLPTQISNAELGEGDDLVQVKFC